MVELLPSAGAIHGRFFRWRFVSFEWAESFFKMLSAAPPSVFSGNLSLRVTVTHIFVEEDAMILEGIIIAQDNDPNAITKREAVDFADMLED
jgi:hypothetical protein